MKEIKVRAWDRTKREMHYDRTFTVVEPESLDDVDFEVKHVSFNGALYAITKASWGVDSNELEFISHDFELMLYTGLKDSENKEIYDGDIVARKHNVSYMSKAFKVEWKSCSTQTGFNLRARNGKQFLSLSVIGNIYENPELLRQGDGS